MSGLSVETPLTGTIRLLILSQHFYPESFRINEVCKGLVRRGHAIDILTGQPNYPEGKIYAGFSAWRGGSGTWQGATIHRVPVLPRGRSGALRLALNYLTFICSAILLGPWLLRGRRCDAVFVYANSPLLQVFAALWIGMLKSAPVIVWVQDLWPESLMATGYVRSGSLLSLVRTMVRFIFRRSDLILVQSPGFIAPVRKLAGTRPVRYMPNPAETIFEDELTAGPTATARVFTALFAGNIGTAQGIEVLVEAAQLLHSNSAIRFVIVGSGSRWQWLRDEITRRGLRNVDLLGRRPLAEMPEHFSRADALLLTLADEPILRLTIPSKLQDYLAAGRPIVASIAGEGARLIENAGAGIAVAPGDSAAIASAIQALAAMSANERLQYGMSGRRFFQEHFTMERILDTVELQVRSAIEGDRP